MGRMIQIALDALGGDHGPDVVAAGAAQAAVPGELEILLVGGVDVPSEHCAGRTPDGVRVVPGGAPSPSTGLAPDRANGSNIGIACDLVRAGHADALVSAGPTGATVATATQRLRRCPGVLRPALAAVLPGDRPTVLADVGAVPDATVAMILQFAVLGTCYARARLGCIGTPSVGLLNIGTEAGKGNRVARAAYEVLQRSDLRFIGNVEGHDLLTGPADVVVTDGFTGNVALKAVEASLGLGRHGPQRDGLDHAAALVGLERTVLAAHGAATATGIAAACRQAAALVGSDVTATIAQHLQQADLGRAVRRGQLFHRRDGGV